MTNRWEVSIVWTHWTKWWDRQSVGQSRRARDFITILRMAINLKLMNSLCLELLFNIFKPRMTRVNLWKVKAWIKGTTVWCLKSMPTLPWKAAYPKSWFRHFPHSAKKSISRRRSPVIPDPDVTKFRVPLHIKETRGLNLRSPIPPNLQPQPCTSAAQPPQPRVDPPDYTFLLL